MKIKPISAKETWQLRQKVMWPDEAIDYVKLPQDELGYHYGLFIDDVLTAVVSLFVNGQEAQFRKLATEVSAQGNGYGTTLLTHLMREAKTLNVKRIWCNARSDKTTFYHKFDLKETAQTFIKNGQSYIVMERSISH